MKLMAAFVEFLESLLHEGKVILRARPQMEASAKKSAERLLAAAYADHGLDVAGPPIAFDAAAALTAAEQLWYAAWFLLKRDDPAEEIDKHLAPRTPPASAAQHLSADLLLRFAPPIHRRARSQDPADHLTKRLEELLRRHPLSGVLADIEEGPLTALRLGDHPGLQLLYAERLAEKPRPAWMPQGPARAAVELVFAERGLVVPEPLPIASEQPS
jgi:hypothetical protein